MVLKYLSAGINAVRLYRNSKLFDVEYYSSRYNIPKCFCILYDVLIGRLFANDPSEDFSTKEYYKAYPDIKESRLPALYHYLKFGEREGRAFQGTIPEVTRFPILDLFDAEWYTKTYLAGSREGAGAPLTHYLTYGWKRKHLPFENFDIDRFYSENPNCREEPLVYWYKSRLPSLYFVDLIKAVFSTRSKDQRALQYIYHFCQDQYARSAIPASHKQQELTVLFAPNMDNLSPSEILSFQELYREYLQKKRADQTIVAVTMPGVPTYCGLGYFPEDFFVLRFSQLTTLIRAWASVTFVVSDNQAGQLYGFLKYNTDDPIHHIRNKQIVIRDYQRDPNLHLLVTRFGEFFDSSSSQFYKVEDPADNPYFGFFDAKWYRQNYLKNRENAEAKWHYYNLGWRKKHRPFQYFDIDRFYAEYPDCDIEPLYYLYKHRIPDFFFTERVIPKMKLENDAGRALQALYRIRQEQAIAQILPFDNTVERLMVILVSPEDAISGGIMSFYGIYHYSRQLESIHKRQVITVTIPGDTTHSGFTMFKNDMPVFRYEMVVRRLSNVKDILLMVPETYIPMYLKFLSENTDDPILGIAKRHLNIMNQKIEIMPERETIDDIKRFFPKVTQTVAHYKYCTQKERDYYGIPTHLLLPPIIKSFKLVPYEKKEEIFAYSYDSKPWKRGVLDNLKREFPRLKFVEILNMSFDEYIDLIHRAKWCMTFGEGLDGYFSEPYQSGSISFAVWNEEYFTSRYKSLPTVLPDVEAALKSLPSLMRSLDNKKAYEQTSAEVRRVHGEEYATSRTSKDQLIDFFNNKYDFP